METKEPVVEHGKRRVAYYYHPDVGSYVYGNDHPMKPLRMRMAHDMISKYRLNRHMSCYRPARAEPEDLQRFHSPEYIDFLRRINYENHMEPEFQKGIGEFLGTSDCPAFDGLYEFCQISSGGSIAAAHRLNAKQCDIAINWMGGLHHARKSEASGFCYTNDIVLAILELLTRHPRVLYVDIDVHHGDGVEEAFYTTDRVMCVSIHNYWRKKDDFFFPGTGELHEVGQGAGKHYSLNMPLSAGITDKYYKMVFKTVMTMVMERFEPSVVVLQCGGDSLAGDLLGPFNLTLRGHGACVRFFRSYNVPLMLLGGGGYTPRNVARCWTYETAIAVGKRVANKIPVHRYTHEYLDNGNRLHIKPERKPDTNNWNDLARKCAQLRCYLKQLPFVPSVQMQPMPPSIESKDGEILDSADPDCRLPEQIANLVVEDQGEFYDDDEPAPSTRSFRRSRRNVQNAKRDVAPVGRARSTKEAKIKKSAETAEAVPNRRITRAQQKEAKNGGPIEKPKNTTRAASGQGKKLAKAGRKTRNARSWKDGEDNEEEEGQNDADVEPDAMDDDDEPAEHEKKKKKEDVVVVEEVLATTDHPIDKEAPRHKRTRR